MDDIDEKLQFLRIVYLLMLVTVGVVAVMGWQLAASLSHGAFDVTIAYCAGAMTLFEMAMIPVLRRRLLAVSSVSSDGPIASVGAGRYFATDLLTWLLCESFAIYGLVLMLLSGNLKFLLGFCALSLFNLALYAPTRRKLAEAMRAG